MQDNLAYRNVEEVSQRVNLVFSLLTRCPGNLQADCVLAEQRRLSLRERYAWAKALPAEEIERIYQHHHDCLHRQYLENIIVTART